MIVLGVGIFILRRGFRPLERILGRVQEIQTGNLQPGLPEEPRPPELQRLADSLNAMWQRLDESFKGRETFFASVSHDFRTPLTALQGQIDVLLLQSSTDRAARESLERMAREVRRLIRLTNNLLLNAQLGSHPPLVAEDVSLRELTEEVVAEMLVLADGRELELRVDEDCLISADRDLLKQMVLNLVDNAIKFTSGGGQVELTVKKEANEAIVEVADSGIGIPSEVLSRLLGGLDVARGVSRQPRGGAGLGLAIAKRVADLHGGRIEISSQEGVGTTVRVALPFSPGDFIETSGTLKTVGPNRGEAR
ncbi:MAG: HAMP domain-containing histidine kinase [Chloroflexi bacterium]|nr:HAMP domain-containing histidine kinase [Chloroflexota bacterium]